MKKSFINKTMLVCGLGFSAFMGSAQAPAISPSSPGLVGLWEFNDTTNLMDATVGNDLIQKGNNPWTKVPGPTATEYAITKTLGSYLEASHGIPANGSGSMVNKWSMVIDFKIPNSSKWRSFLQTDTTNSNDGDLFVKTNNSVGIAALGYSATNLIKEEWYRMVFSVDNGNVIKMYMDGSLWVTGTGPVDGRFALNAAKVLLFADENGEDHPMDVANIALFDKALTSNEAFTLGGYGHVPNPPVVTASGIKPYLQSSTPNSIHISWHSTDATSTNVKYGTTKNNLNTIAAGTNQVVHGGNLNYIWHTVELTGLTPDTEYFYRCISGTSDSTDSVFAFRTPPALSDSGQHIRFIVMGDNRTDIAKTTANVAAMKAKLTQMFGPDLHNHIDLIASVGDIVTNGNSISQYKNEYFTPLSPLTHAIPSMISIGNHEGNSAKFYDYMKYEDYTDGFPAPHPYNEKFYQFSLGTVQFIFLNGNTNYRITDQVTWLDNVLRASEADTTVDFIFSFTHQPGHSEIWPSGNSSFVQNDILGLLNKFYKSSIHFSGHSHNYERGTIEMDNSDPLLQHDMRELLSGGAGSVLDRWGMYANQTDYPEVNKSLDIYSWTLIDVDVDNKSYTAQIFSFGHNDVPANNEIVDEFYRIIDQPRAEKPSAAGVIGGEKLVASPMIGVDSAYTSHFQITSFPGIYTNPDVEIKQDVENWYEDSGAPNYIPTNQNEGLDIKRYAIQSADGLISGNTYGYRVRYRDYNLEWTEWSDENTFVYSPNASIVTDFVATDTVGEPGIIIGFNDLSTINGVSYEWDFDNDGIVDSKLQDPVYQFNTAGVYTVKLTINDGTQNHQVVKNAHINISKKSSIGIPTNAEELTSLKVYPNPINENSAITFDLKQSDDITIKVVDLNGKTVQSVFEGSKNAGSHSFKLNPTLAPGTYFIVVEGNNTKGTQKVIIL